MKLNTTLVIIAYCVHAVLCRTTASPPNTTKSSNTTTTQKAQTLINGLLSPADYKKLETAVKNIVGANLKPSKAMVELAFKQGGAPQKMDDMMSYISLFQKLAREKNVPIPGVFGTPTSTQIDEYILENAITWFNTKSSGVKPTTPPPPQTGNNNMFQNDLFGLFNMNMGMGMGMGNAYDPMHGNQNQQQEMDLYTLMLLNNALGSENSMFVI